MLKRTDGRRPTALELWMTRYLKINFPDGVPEADERALDEAALAHAYDVGYLGYVIVWARKDGGCPKFEKSLDGVVYHTFEEADTNADIIRRSNPSGVLAVRKVVVHFYPLEET